MSRLIGFSLAVLIAGFPAAHPAVAGAEKTAERVTVAKVNGRPLYQDQLAPILKAQKKKLPHRGGAKPEPAAVVQRRAIDQLIDVELLAQQARNLKVAGLEEKVNNRIAGLRHAQPALFAEKPEEEIRELLSEEFRVEAYLQAQGVADPEILEAEIRAFYDKGQESFRREEAAHLRHISIQLPADASTAKKTAARETLQQARQRILAGATFKSAGEEILRAPEASQDDLGFLTSRDMPEAIAKAAFALDPGKISEVIDTPSGVHLVEVLARKPAGVVPYEEVKDFIRKYLQEGRSRQAYQKLVQGLRQQAEIEILPGPG